MSPPPSSPLPTSPDASGVNQTSSLALPAPQGGAQQTPNESPSGKVSVEGEEQPTQYAPPHSTPTATPARDPHTLPRLPTDTTPEPKAPSSPTTGVTPWLFPDQLSLMRRRPSQEGDLFSFLGCHGGNLDQMMEFTMELLPLASKLLSRPPVAHNNIHHRGAREDPSAESVPGSSAVISQRRWRNQHRPQQRKARRHQYHKPEEETKIQMLYRCYQRKALRKVLGEESPYYSGGRDRLEEHVAVTYHRTEVSPEGIAEARRHFDNCQWEQPDKKEFWQLPSSPSADEIVLWLRRTINTSPGMDGVEWRHLKAIDRTGTLLQTVLSAVYSLGIPSSWRRSRTVLIHKKGETDDPGNFRPISLLNTLYKLYSGILASRIIRIATRHHWLSAEQKGFLPGVRRIQEHTFLPQTAIDEAKKHRGDLSVTWLDLTNAFGSSHTRV